jgi:hypothetical protein
MRPLRVFTWHIHGSYLFYLSHIRHEIVVPVRAGHPPGYAGRGGTFPWPDNVCEVPAEDVCRQQFDCILFQSRQNYLEDQYEILSPAQRRLPRVYLEHDPPREHPTDTRHPVDDPNVLLVHVTAFNDLMWNSGSTPVRVIEHGVTVPSGIRYTGEVARGLVAINDLRTRGRRLGADIFEEARREVPLDLVGMDSEAMGGLGEVPPPGLAEFAARYRFFFNPIRYTSLGLAIIEAMMVGLPVVGLATAELVSVIENGVSGFIDTDRHRLIPHMRDLIDDPQLARRLGETARQRAEARFNVGRFVRDWEEVLALVTSTREPSPGTATRIPITARQPQ